MIKIGSHVSFKAPDFLLGVNNVSIENGATAAMFYLGAPQNTRRVEKEKYKLEEYKKIEKRIPIENMVIHAPYIVNPANKEKAKFAQEFLIQEIKNTDYLGIKYFVLHPGAHTKWTREEGLLQLIESLQVIIKNTSNVEILLETMAGKGTELGTSFEELKYIIESVGSERINICLDTCHIWDSGINIKDFQLFKNFLIDNDYLKYIKVIHVNDSKNELSSHKDRHENIDKGFIGIKTLKNFIHDPIFKDVVKILETPFSDGIYKKEISMLIKK